DDVTGDLGVWVGDEADQAAGGVCLNCPDLPLTLVAVALDCVKVGRLRRMIEPGARSCGWFGWSFLRRFGQCLGSARAQKPCVARAAAGGTKESGRADP